MKKKDIFRVTQLCIPKLPSSSSDDDDKDGITSPHHQLLDASDMRVSSVCSLWSGMGHIYKVQLPASCNRETLIIKHVGAPRNKNPQHQQSIGDRRKADSYQVEANFYDKLAPRLIQQGVRLPTPCLVERDAGKSNNEIVICMSYVESAADVVSDDDEAVKAVLTWLASLHAAYWGNRAVDAIVDEVGLQPQGSYWHLDTRPDEHEAMPNNGWQGRLKRAAKAIDRRLKRDPTQCLIHGDAKDANVLFSRKVDDDENKKSTLLQVAMCDFQYCGKGPPSKDLAYFFISSVSPEDEEVFLEFYLNELTMRLAAKAKETTTTGAGAPLIPPPPSMNELKESMDLAYCDFYRFMSGWGFWGADNAEDRVRRILDRLDGGKDLGLEEAYDEAVQREFGR